MQPTPSSALGSALSWQSMVAWQVSTPVQNRLSSQLESLTVLTMTSLTSSQLSSVQPTPSSALGSALSWQPEAGSQVSTPVQNWPSSQGSAGPLTQAPAEQVSVVVQALLSSQGRVLSLLKQPLPTTHTSSVHPLASSQRSEGSSSAQVDEQQSLLVLLASSHSSPVSAIPFPQTLICLPSTKKSSLCKPPGGSPGPSMRR